MANQTARQTLVTKTAKEIVKRNMEAIRHNMGQSQPNIPADMALRGFNPYGIDKESLLRWNEMIEGVAWEQGGDVWKWYERSSENSYKRIIFSIRKEYRERMFMAWLAFQVEVMGGIDWQP